MCQKENQILDDGKMITSTGVIFDLINPDMNDVHIEDIAHGLAYTCRWNGHTKTYYSVAEHSIKVYGMVADRCRQRGNFSRQGALAALLHDAEEAYWGDIIRPIKNIYPEIEDKLTKLRMGIMSKYGGKYIEYLDEIKWADDKCLQWEYKNIVLESKVATEHPFLVKQRFLHTFDTIYVK